MTTKEGAGRTVLVTGASAGIGKALAEVFAEHGFSLVLTARREDRLREVAEQLAAAHGVSATVVTADLAQADAPARLFEEVQRRGIQVDALVNNAGYGVPRTFRKNPWPVHAAFLQVMVTAVVQLCHLFEPGMRERGYGRILNVASLAGLTPQSAGHTLYGASKAFMIKFSESLALEHAGDGVHVTALCPGFTYSEFHDVVGNRAQVSTLPSAMWMDAERVAREGYEAVMAGDVIRVPGAVNRALAVAARLIPTGVASTLMKRQKRLRVSD